MWILLFVFFYVRLFMTASRPIVQVVLQNKTVPTTRCYWRVSWGRPTQNHLWILQSILSRHLHPAPAAGGANRKRYLMRPLCRLSHRRCYSRQMSTFVYVYFWNNWCVSVWMLIGNMIVTGYYNGVFVKRASGDKTHYCWKHIGCY